MDVGFLHSILWENRWYTEVVGFSGLRDLRVPGYNSYASSDRHKMDMDVKQSEVL